MNEQTSIRPRLPEDLPDLGKALVQVYNLDGYPVEGVGDPQAWLQPAGLIQAWTAELHGQVAGHVVVSELSASDDAAGLYTRHAPGERIAVLERLFVLPTARGRALGERLVQTATAFAMEQHYRLALDVMTKDLPAIRLYERLGWLLIGTVDHDDGHGNTVPAYCYVSPSVHK